MEIKFLDYHIVIEPDIQEDTGDRVYSAFCPNLGVAAWGKTVDETITHAKEAIESYVKSFTQHGKPIPSLRPGEEIVVRTQIRLPKGARVVTV